MRFKFPALSKELAFLSVLICLLSSCEQGEYRLDIPFVAAYQQQPLNCDSNFSHQDRWQIKQLLFYVSKVQTKISGHWHTVTLQNNYWQNDDIALIGEACNNQAHWALNLKLNVDPSKIQALRFELAVPFDKNHANPLRASGVLSNSNMFWSWQLGYKFFRLDLGSLNETQSDWAFHLGSTGCNSASSVRGPNEPCANPNRLQVTLEHYKEGAGVTIDLAMLLNGIDIGQQSRCLSMPTQGSCPLLFKNMGLMNSGLSIFGVTDD